MGEPPPAGDVEMEDEASEADEASRGTDQVEEVPDPVETREWGFDPDMWVNPDPEEGADNPTVEFPSSASSRHESDGEETYEAQEGESGSETASPAIAAPPATPTLEHSEQLAIELQPTEGTSRPGRRSKIEAQSKIKVGTLLTSRWLKEKKKQTKPLPLPRPLPKAEKKKKGRGVVSREWAALPAVRNPPAPQGPEASAAAAEKEEVVVPDLPGERVNPTEAGMTGKREMASSSDEEKPGHSRSSEGGRYHKVLKAGEEDDVTRLDPHRVQRGNKKKNRERSRQPPFAPPNPVLTDDEPMEEAAAAGEAAANQHARA